MEVNVDLFEFICIPILFICYAFFANFIIYLLYRYYQLSSCIAAMLDLRLWQELWEAVPYDGPLFGSPKVLVSR